MNQVEPTAARHADHAVMANAIRVLAMDAVEKAKSGHPGMPMGMADAATVLFARHLRFDPARPDWPDRDRFVLSAGHGSMLLYAVLHLTGYADMPMDELRRFRQLGARTAGHPEFGAAGGIETTTGPLGQGLGNAVGMALAERALAARFGADLVDHRTYVIAGDGCLMEGISHEAISLAGHLGLSRLVVLWDDNRISIDGPTDLAVSDDQLARFAACGWATVAVDGHDPAAIDAALAAAKTATKPTLIACRTKIGYGAPKKEGSASSHGSPLGPEEIAGTRQKLAWPHAPFEIPADILAAWRKAGSRCASASAAWAKRLAASPDRAEFERRIAGKLPETLGAALAAHRVALAKDKPKVATRKASELAIEALAPVMPELIGGSADLTGSNNTKAKSQKVLNRGNYGGTYIHFGVREHAMAAAMNGMALHGGVVPYGGTFLVFTDYCRPSIRLAAMMKRRAIFIMTHDSIGLGEDGPTHQPVEHLAALRAIPNLLVMRPADAMETAECWDIALKHATGPSVLALTRQDLVALRTDAAGENRSAKGAYELRAAKGPAKVTLIGTGSEVHVALAAADTLEADGIGARVVSMPCWELFLRQDEASRRALLGPGTAKVVVEAGIAQGWERVVGSDAAFIGMDRFGVSAPSPELYAHFGITPDAVASAAKARLKS